MLISGTPPLRQGRHCAFLTAFHIWFQAYFNSRAVQWQIHKYKRQLYRLLLWKSENVCHNLETKKVIPCTALTCVKAATIRPAASYSRLSKSSTLIKRGIGCIYLSKILPLFFFAVPFPLFLLFSFSICTFVSVFRFVNDLFDSELRTLGLKLYLIYGKILNIWLLTAPT